MPEPEDKKQTSADRNAEAQGKTLLALRAANTLAETKKKDIDHKNNLGTAQAARAIADAGMGCAFMGTVAVAQISNIAPAIGKAAKSMASGGGHTTVAFAGLNIMLSLGHMAHSYHMAKKKKDPRIIKKFWLGENGLKTLIPAGLAIAAGTCMIIFATQIPLVILLVSCAIAAQNITDIIYHATQAGKGRNKLGSLEDLQKLTQTRGMSAQENALALLGPELLYKHGFLGNTTAKEDNSEKTNEEKMLSEREMEDAIDMALARPKQSAETHDLINNFKKRQDKASRNKSLPKNSNAISADATEADTKPMPTPQEMKVLIENFKKKKLSNDEIRSLGSFFRPVKNKIRNEISATKKEIQMSEKKLAISGIVTLICAAGLSLVSAGVTMANPVVLGIGAAIMASLAVFGIVMGIIGLVKKYKENKTAQKPILSIGANALLPKAEELANTEKIKALESAEPSKEKGDATEPEKVIEKAEGSNTDTNTGIADPNATTDLTSRCNKKKMLTEATITQEDSYCPSKKESAKTTKGKTHNNAFGDQTRVNTMPPSVAAQRSELTHGGLPPRTKKPIKKEASKRAERKAAKKALSGMTRSLRKHPSGNTPRKAQGTGLGATAAGYNGTDTTKSPTTRRVSWLSNKGGASSLAQAENRTSHSPRHEQSSTGSFRASP